MRCEESFITMKLIWHNYLILNLNHCVHKTPTETHVNCMPASWFLLGSLAFSVINYRACVIPE